MTICDDMLASKRQEALREQSSKLESSTSRASALEAQLASATASHQEALDRAAAAEAEASGHRRQVDELRQQLSKASEPSERPESGLSMADPNLAQLVFEATSSREEAMKEKHLREQYQEALDHLYWKSHEITEHHVKIM